MNLHRLALDAIDRAADMLGLDDWVRAVLAQPERTIAVQVPYVDDDGNTRVVPGYRVAHSTARGPALRDLWEVADTRRLPLRDAATVLGVGPIADAVVRREGARVAELAS